MQKSKKKIQLPNEERAKILLLVKDGSLSPDEAAKMIEEMEDDLANSSVCKS